MRRPLLPKTASGRPLAAEGRTARRASISIVAGMCRVSLCWGPTFDMSGGPKDAKRPLERPLDGGVRCPHAAVTHGCGLGQLARMIASFFPQ